MRKITFLFLNLLLTLSISFAKENIGVGQANENIASISNTNSSESDKETNSDAKTPISPVKRPIVATQGFLDITPFSHSFEPKGRENTTQYTLSNNSNKPMAFETNVFTRDVDDKGNDVLEQDDSSFVIAPRQVIVPPNEKRLIRVQWKGNEKFKTAPDREQAFRVAFEQFPIDFESGKRKDGATITIRFKLVASLYMTPSSARTKLRVVSISRDAQGQQIISIKNEGTKRGYANESEIEVNIFGKNQRLKDLNIKDINGFVIMPGKEREFVVVQEAKHSAKSESGGEKTESVERKTKSEEKN